jgi:hypothetical protein
MPLRDLVPKFGTVCPLEQEEKPKVFFVPCRRQDWNFFKKLPTGFGAGTPQQVPGQNHETEFLGLKEKLALK